MKNICIILISVLTVLLMACGGNTSTNESGKTAAKKADDGKGVGEVKNVTLNDPLKPEMVEKGKAIYEMKCAACHKLSGQRVVGPGWEGLTTKRKPEWIMNMVTNVEVMLAEDSTARALLKECLVQMPNQNLTIGDARDVLEFMYANDGKTVGE
ncbi:MAG: c-type cytochrome [Bacteroidia bacterium]